MMNNSDIFENRAVAEILSREDFCAHNPFRHTKIGFGESMVDIDGESHEKIRKIVDPFFSKENVFKLDTIIKKIVKKVFSNTDSLEEIDVVNDIAYPISLETACSAYNINASYVVDFKNPVDNVALYITGEKIPVKKLLNSKQCLEEYIKDLWGSNSIGGPLGALKTASDQGEIPEDIALHTASLLIVSAVSTSVAAICIVFKNIRNKYLTSLSNDNETLYKWLINTLKNDPPLVHISRFSNGSVVLNGNTYSQGDSCSLFLGDDAIGKTTKLLIFGYGEHACPGNQVALIELKYVVKEIMERITKYSRIVSYKERVCSLKIPLEFRYRWL